MPKQNYCNKILETELWQQNYRKNVARNYRKQNIERKWRKTDKQVNCPILLSNLLQPFLL